MTPRVLAITFAFVVTFPVAMKAQALPDPSTDPDGGPLLVSIWDSNRQVSLVFAVPGVTYQDARDGSFTGFSDPVPGFDDVVGNSNPHDVSYTVTLSGKFSPGFPSAPNSALFVTEPTALPDLTNLMVSSAAIEVRTFVNDIAAAGCESGASCTADDFNDVFYPGRFPFGELTSTLPFSAAGNLGDALRFWDLAQRGDDSLFPGFPLFDAGARAFATDTLGTWLLDTDGMLTYTAVPIPAGVWLLLSAVCGLLPLRRASIHRPPPT